MRQTKIRDARSPRRDREPHHQVLVLARDQQRDSCLVEHLPPPATNPAFEQGRIDRVGFLPLRDDLVRIAQLGVMVGPQGSKVVLLASAFRRRKSSSHGRQCFGAKLRRRATAPKYILQALAIDVLDRPPCRRKPSTGC